MPLPGSASLRLRGLCLVSDGFTSKSVGLLMPFVAWPAWNATYYLLSVLLCVHRTWGLDGTGILFALEGSAPCLIVGWEPYAWRHIIDHDTVFCIHLFHGRRVRRSCGTTPVAGASRLQSRSADAGMHRLVEIMGVDVAYLEELASYGRMGATVIILQCFPSPCFPSPPFSPFSACFLFPSDLLSRAPSRAYAMSAMPPPRLGSRGRCGRPFCHMICLR